jgi:hypothetical protein
MNRLVAVTLIAAVSACSSEPSRTPFEVITDEGPTVTYSLEEADSALAALSPTADSEYEGSRKELAELLIAPARVGEFRLIGLVADDPNGNGRIDGRWYPPRLRTGNCQLQVDAAPIPSATATFAPGAPNTQMPENTFALTNLTMKADVVIGVGVQLFDDATQREEYVQAMREFYADSWTMGCENSADPPDDRLEEVDAHPSDYPSFSFAGRLGFNLMRVSHYSVGDRVLLTVTAQAGILARKKEVPSDDIAAAAIDAEIARLVELGFG